MSICIAFVIAIFLLLAGVNLKTTKVSAGAIQKGDDEQQFTVFSNPAAISPVDRPSNSAGTNPGIPASNYPSPIVVAGLSGAVTKITVTFAITTTFPDDLDVLLVGPTGAKSLVMSDAGGSGDHTNVSFTFDQDAASAMPDGPTTPIPSGTFKPSNYVGFATPEPGGQDNFPSAGGLAAYTADFTVFNGTNPNGTWNLYVVDDQNIDLNSLPGGWSINITVGAAPDAPVDFNGDNRSDYAVVRNPGGGALTQTTWYIQYSSGGAANVVDWGLGSDFYLAEDFDNDNKDDIAVWRAGAPTVAAFYILNSATSTVRAEPFGQTGDDPTVVDDYNGDGAADLAVYRAGATAGAQSLWYYRTTPGGPLTVIGWGVNGDLPSPGDYDGDGLADFVVQRPSGGLGVFWRRFATGASDALQFGLDTDMIAPGDYDDDGKTDVCVVRAGGGVLTWYYEPSGTAGVSVVQTTFGASASDFPAQGDYDGDGRTEVAIWRNTNGTFWVLNLQTSAVSAFQFGIPGDYPVANFNVH